MLLYDQLREFLGITECRKCLFSQNYRMFEAIPPTAAALVEHTKRVIYQGGYIWRKRLENLPNWGWTRDSECELVHFLTTLSETSVSVRKEGNVLFNDALNTFYLRLYGVGHMVKDHSDSERGNPLPPHGLLFPINSKGSFICTIPQTG